MISPYRLRWKTRLERVSWWRWRVRYVLQAWNPEKGKWIDTEPDEIA